MQIEVILLQEWLKETVPSVHFDTNFIIVPYVVIQTRKIGQKMDFRNFDEPVQPLYDVITK